MDQRTSLRFGLVPRRVTAGVHRVHPRWDDGSKIVFSASRAGGSALETINADGTGRKLLTAKKGQSYDHPAWSPDGRWIVFESAPHEDWGQLTIVRPDGTGRRCLVKAQTKPVPQQPAWSSDSTRVAYVAEGINIITVKSGKTTRVTESGSTPRLSADNSTIEYYR